MGEGELRLETAEITEKSQVTADLWWIRLRAPRISREARPGQFLHVRVADSMDPLLRRPMSISGIGQGDLELLVRPVGRGSRLMVEKAVGEKLDCLGPLGNGFKLHRGSRNLLLMGGGSGIGPIVAMARHAVSVGCSVVVLFGFRSADRVYPSRLLPAEVEYLIATDDGSVGHRGMVTDLARDFLGWADAVYACGPRAMYIALLEMVRVAGVRKPVQVSLEENMACGVGACFGCVVQTRRGDMKSVCEDGPVFELRDLVWG